MVFIDTPYDFTLTPYVDNNAMLQQTLNTANVGTSIDSCIKQNQIYQGNGLICQQKISECMGCDPNTIDSDKVLQFCGVNSTPCFYINGNYYCSGPGRAGPGINPNPPNQYY